MPETTGGTRIRVKVETTSKGVPSWDATVEMWDDEGLPQALKIKVLALSDKLHESLKVRYGAQQEAAK